MIVSRYNVISLSIISEITRAITLVSVRLMTASEPSGGRARGILSIVGKRRALIFNFLQVKGYLVLEIFVSLTNW